MIAELEMQQIQPWRELNTCPKCGERERNSWWRRLWQRRICFRHMWCPGGRQVAEDDGEQPVSICVGVGEQHLHVVCALCGYTWLMATRDSLKPPVDAVVAELTGPERL